jgi:hypothetical protein
VKEYFIRVHGRDLVFEQQAPKGGVNFNPTTESNEDY